MLVLRTAEAGGEASGGGAGQGATALAGGSAAGGAGAAGGGSGGGSDAGWLSQIADADLRGFAESKGFEKPEVALEAYRNLEKVMGVPKERLLKLPEKADDPGWAEVYERLGRPKEAGHYSVPEALADDPVVGKMREAAHKANLTAAQWDAMQGVLQETAAAVTQERTAGWEAKAAGELESLRSEWGAAYEEKV